MDKNLLKDLAAECYRTQGNDITAEVLDKIKRLGFHYAGKSGTTIAINDIEVPAQKADLMATATTKIEGLEEQFQRGLITEDERYNTAVQIWTDTSDQMTKVIEEHLPTYGGVYLMAISGAKGNVAQIKQMAGMRGLMSNPRGRIIELPIKSSFREGLSVLEYFISTHGARKGLADTALRTADSGYLTRRLIDVSQEVIILEYDCGTGLGITIETHPERPLEAPFATRIVGRTAGAPVVDPATGEIIVDRNEEISEELADRLVELGINEVFVRSPLNCESRSGMCGLCYGRNPATGKLAIIGEAVGVMAAQSIGEPGTQLDHAHVPHRRHRRRRHHQRPAESRRALRGPVAERDRRTWWTSTAWCSVSTMETRGASGWAARRSSARNIRCPSATSRWLHSGELVEVGATLAGPEEPTESTDEDVPQPSSSDGARVRTHRGKRGCHHPRLGGERGEGVFDSQQPRISLWRTGPRSALVTPSRPAR